MTQQEYEQKRFNEWLRYKRDNSYGPEVKIVFDYAFDRAYALGKQTETISQEEIERASVEYADKTARQYAACNSEFVQEIMVAFEQGASFALGKQEKNAEGEEMLTIEKSKVQQQYNRAIEFKDDADPKWNLAGDQIARVLSGLFGSKCLPDEDPKPTSSNVNNSDIDIAELVAKGHVPDPAQHFDHILKASFSKERRLNIAAQMMQGLICAPLVPGVDPNPPAEHLAWTAFMLADALIAQSELTTI